MGTERRCGFLRQCRGSNSLVGETLEAQATQTWVQILRDLGECVTFMEPSFVIGKMRIISPAGWVGETR